MPRFVLLHHDCPPDYERSSHWDLMLETGNVLRTWALEQLPCDWKLAHSRTVSADANCPAIATSNEVAAVRLGDHRRDYLELEGPLSGGRGTVVRVAAGTYEIEHESPDELRIVVEEPELAGRVVLWQKGVDGQEWKLSTQP
jgi:DNA polymerase ligase (LigD)-like protein